MVVDGVDAVDFGGGGCEVDVGVENGWVAGGWGWRDRVSVARGDYGVGEVVSSMLGEDGRTGRFGGAGVVEGGESGEEPVEGWGEVRWEVGLLEENVVVVLG